MSEETVMGADAPQADQSVTQDIGGSWRDSLPDDFRDKYTEFKDPVDFVKGYDGLVKKMGANPIVAPKEDASDEDRAAYRDRLFQELGFTGDEKDYQLNVDSIPDDYKDAITPESFAPYKEIAMKHKIPPEAFKELTDLYINETVEGASSIDKHIEQGREQAAKILQDEWGDKFNEKVGAARELAQAIVPDFLENPQYGNDPNIIKAFAQIRENMTLQEEGKIRDAVSVQDDPVALRERANELNLKSMDVKLPLDVREKASEEARKIYQRIYKG